MGSPPVFREHDDGEEKVANDEEDGDEEEDLVDVLKSLTIKEDEMNIETIYVPNVGLRGHSLTVRHHIIIMLSIDFPPGARLKLVNITIDDKDPNKGCVNVDISPYLSVPEERFSS
jgi:hypothetical protein